MAVSQLFGGNSSFLKAGNFEYEQKETKTKYDLKKKKHVSPPAGGLGQYKPKILTLDSSGQVPAYKESEDKKASNKGRAPLLPHEATKENGSTSAFGTFQTNNGINTSRPFVVGDKDTPMVLYDTPDFKEVASGLHNLSLTSEDGRQVPTSSSTPGIETRNPLFMTTTEKEKATSTENKQQDIFIPAPDYDEEEKTIDFTDDGDVTEQASPSRGKQVFKEYGGEDFAHYLFEEEAETVTMRPKQVSIQTQRKSQTEAKRSYYKKRGSSSPSKRLSKKDKAASGSLSSLRNFTYADSKFGTVAMAEKPRTSVRSLTDVEVEAEVFVDTGSSYETFLRSINGEFVNGAFTSDELASVPKMSKPDHSEGSQKQGKDTLWKRLTWRLK